LIGELFPIISFPTLFSYQIRRTLLGTYIAPIGDGASIWAKVREESGERGDRKWIHPEVIEMKYSAKKFKIRMVEIIFYAIGVIVLLLLGVIASG
jgi:hypothetical protein